MSYSIIGASASAGNASYATIYTQPALTTGGVIGNVTAYNTTGGALTLTLAIVRQDGTTVVQATESINGTTPASYGRGSTKCICPLSLLPGETIKAQGSGPGLTVTVSGVSFSS